MSVETRAQATESFIADQQHSFLFATFGFVTAILLMAGLYFLWSALGQTVAARQKSEKNLRESEERFRALAELSSDFFWEMDSEFRFTRFYGQGAERTKSRYIGKKRWDSATEDDAAQLEKWADHKKTLESHKPFRNFEFQVKTDPPHWDSISGQPIFNDDGEFVGYLGSATDITPRKNTELALLESEKRLSLSLESGGIGTFSWNIKDGTHYWDDRNHEIWGLKPGTYAGVTETDFINNIHPEDGDMMVWDALSDVLAGDIDFDLEYRIIRPDKTTAYIHAAAILTRDKNGQPEKMMGVSHDITERKRAEEDLIISERNYRAMLETSPIGVGTMNLDDWHIQFSNNRLTDILGVTRHDLENRPQGDFWANPDDQSDFVDAFLREGK